MGHLTIATSGHENRVKIQQLLAQTCKIIVNKEQTVKLCVASLFAEGHLLIEDRPGMGKTSLLKALSQLLGLSTQRIQLTNDMLPADIIGTSIFNPQTRGFEFHQGPLFANFVLADEINRASPKTQSACLQAMEEKRVTVDRISYDLPHPFFLVATQNPQDNVGTFPLPDSQLDRFLMKLELGLPSRSAEREILVGRDRHAWIDELTPLFLPEEIHQIIAQVKKVHVAESALDYLQDIVEKSRQISCGLSPRGARDFNRAAKAYAYLENREFVIPEDYQAVGVAVMAHRLNSGSDNPSVGFELAREIIHSVPVA